MNMARVKAGDLIGDALNWAVDWAASEVFGHDAAFSQTVPFSPLTDWGQAGPLIDKFGVSVISNGDEYCAYIGLNAHQDDWGWRNKACGDTYLTAAMRVIVINELGDYVSVPAELL